MTEEAKKIANKLNMATIDKDILDQLIKDRVDFGFDSIYFRYAELCDELAAYQARCEHIDPVQARKNLNFKKMHFYNALEQLIQAHKDDNK